MKPQSSSPTTANTNPHSCLKLRDGPTGDPQSGKKANRLPGDQGRHPVYRGIRMRSWGKWVSEIREPVYGSGRSRTRRCPPEPTTSPPILNFPNFAGSLPRPASLSLRDVQAAAALASRMGSPDCPVSSTGGLLSSLASESEEGELCEIIKLPRLGSSTGLGTAGAELVLVEAADGGVGLYHPPWMQVDGPRLDWFGGFEGLLWDT